MNRQTPGATIVELVLVLALFSLVVAGLAGFVAGLGRLARTQSDEARFSEAVRAARVILGGEVRMLAPTDIAAHGPDSVRIRAFRGGGRVCSSTGTQIGVRYRGHRQPDPAKDSIVLVTAAGEQRRRLAGVSGAACDGQGLLLVVDAPLAFEPALVLLYETGAYHLAEGALRYRRGAGGRQPLIEALLGAASFELGGGFVRFEAVPGPDSVPAVQTPARVSVSRMNVLMP